MTITLPEWFVWFFVIWCVLHTCVGIADLILHGYQHRLDALKRERQ